MSSQISGPGGAVVRLRIHGILILVGVIGIGNFARQLFRHGIIAARVFRLDRRRADDHFRAERFQQIDFFARLLVGNGENDFVAAHRRHQRKSHAGIAGRAFNDRAARLEQTLSFSASSIIDDGNAVFHRAAGIYVVGFHVNFGVKRLWRRGSAGSAACGRSLRECCCTSSWALFPKFFAVESKLRVFRETVSSGSFERLPRRAQPGNRIGSHVLCFAGRAESSSTGRAFPTTRSFCFLLTRGSGPIKESE